MRVYAVAADSVAVSVCCKYVYVTLLPATPPPALSTRAGRACGARPCLADPADAFVCGFRANLACGRSRRKRDPSRPPASRCSTLVDTSRYAAARKSSCPRAPQQRALSGNKKAATAPRAPFAPYARKHGARSRRPCRLACAFVAPGAQQPPPNSALTRAPERPHGHARHSRRHVTLVRRLLRLPLLPPDHTQLVGSVAGLLSADGPRQHVATG